MNKIFDKAIITTDLHIGKKNNDKIFLDDCKDFVDWSIDLGKKHGADTYIHLGDWHDNRKSISIHTLNLSLEMLEKIANSFEKFFLVLGNHDLFYRERRCVNSIEFSRNIKNLSLIKDPLITEQCSFFPWMLQDEKPLLQKTRSKYIFGHFELSGFFTNNMEKMPDTGFLDREIFHKDVEYVFSGHFHKRQEQKNKNGTRVIYIGNCFPHNFSDANDNKRGAVILSHEEEPVFYDWEDSPFYMQTKLSKFLLDICDGLEPRKLTLKCIVDIDLPFDKIAYIKDILQKHYSGIRDMYFVFPNYENNDPFEETGQNLHFETIESIILKGLEMVESPNISRELLLQIYKTL